MATVSQVFGTILVCTMFVTVLHIVELLLDWKANIKACDLQGNTALHHACQRKHDESALLLLERTDEVEVVNMTNRELRTYVYSLALSVTCKNLLTGL